MDDFSFMQEALKEAQKAAKVGEVPIGAVLALDGKIIARAHNRREKSKNPLHHAEILVLEEGAKKIGDWRLEKTVLYVTLEPCPMCAGALLQARISRLVFGCADPNRLGAGLEPAPTFPSLKEIKKLSGNNHTVEITGGILEEECRQVLKRFFKSIR